MLRRLEEDGGDPTEADLARLGAWSGWGGLSPVFDESKTNMDDRRERLRAMLSEAEWQSAQAGVLNAHYTHPAYVSAIWDALQEAGLTQGRVLEPGCGAGTFIGLAPEGVEMTGVELDTMTAQVTQNLYPQATIRNEGYEDTPTTALFDAAVGNVPFGDIRLYDPANNPGRHSIHNHFIIKSLAQTKPGGYVAVITSHYTLDALNPAARRDMYALGDLVSAVRLPSGAHRNAAGTEALTDVLVFRRRKEGETPQPFTWERAQNIDNGQEARRVSLSDFMAQDSGRVLGTYSIGHGMYNAAALTVTGADTPQAIAEQLRERLSADLRAAQAASLAYETTPAPTPTFDFASTLSEQEKRSPLGHIRRTASGTFEQLSKDGYVPFKVFKTDAAEMGALLDLRDKTVALVEAETAQRHDSPELDALRQGLAQAYERYTLTYGALNRAEVKVTVSEVKETDEMGEEIKVKVEDYTTKRPRVVQKFSADPHAALTRAIEVYNDDTGDFSPAPLLSNRQIFASYTPQGADTPADALAISVEHKGGIDLDYIAHLLGLNNAHQAREALGELVYDTPEGSLVSAEEYLSGNVRIKLDQARQAAFDEPDKWAGNIAALEAVLPRDLEAHEVTPRMGASWIEAKVYAAFMREVLEEPIYDTAVEYNPVSGWSIEGSRRGAAYAGNTKWGAPKTPATRIVELILNKEPIVVYDRVVQDGKSVRVVNPSATAAANGQAQRIEEAFAQWIFSNPSRTNALLGEYNRRFNSTVLRSYDAAGENLQMPGLSSAFTLRPAQKAAIARMIAEPTTGLFHEVGAGKTLEMVGGVMEQKRLGLINKPIVVVPNHMLAQFEREWLAAYPNARILTADTNGLSKSARAEFFARATTSSWDAIIVTQSAFERIPLSHERQLEHTEKRLRAFDEFMSAQSESSSFSVRQRQQARKNLENTIKTLKDKLAQRSDDGLSFEQLGVDYVVVDEAHHYKNYSADTRMQGVIATSTSQRAADLDMKIDYLRQVHGERVATFATATPVANTMGEMWVMMNYLRPDLLKSAGIATFDQWIATFGTPKQTVEASLTGSFKVKQRIAKFVNMPELLTMWSTVADVKTAKDLNLPVPKLEENSDGKRAPHIVKVNAGQAMIEFSQSLQQRAELIESGAVPAHQDNYLKMANDARAVATDYRLLQGDSKDALGTVTSPFGTQKVDAAAANIARIYHENKERIYLDEHGKPSPTPGAFQIVFVDRGTPKKNQWNVYDELKEQLVAQGIPADKIAFIHDAKDSAAKGEMFAKARSGGYAVLIGSTEKMGTGANMQARALALHHLDAPWRPADLAQREGRIVRQGNQNAQVAIYRYVTENSFDTFMWQTLERKASYINQVMSSSLPGREVEDISASDEEMSYAQAKAIASGNPYIMDEARLKNEVNELRTRERMFTQSMRARRSAGDSARFAQKALRDRLDVLPSIISRIQDTSGQNFSMSIDGVTYTERVEAQQALVRFFHQNINHASAQRRQILGQYQTPITLGGMPLEVVCEPNLKRAYEYPTHPYTISFSLRDFDSLHRWLDRDSYGEFVFDKPEGIGMVTRMENYLRTVASSPERLEERIRELDVKITQADKAEANPWTDKLRAAESELAELHRLMAQADSSQTTLPMEQVEARQDEPKEKENSEQQIVRENVEQHQEQAPVAVTAPPEQERNAHSDFLNSHVVISTVQMNPRQSPRESSAAPEIIQMHSLRRRSFTPGAQVGDLDTVHPVWGAPRVVSGQRTDAGTVSFPRLIAPGIAAAEVNDGADTVIVLSGQRRNSLPHYAQRVDCCYVGWRKDYVLAAWPEEFAQSEYAQLLTGATNAKDIRQQALEHLRQEVPVIAEGLEEWLAKEEQQASTSHPYARLLGGQSPAARKLEQRAARSNTDTSSVVHQSRFNRPPTQGMSR